MLEENWKTASTLFHKLREILRGHLQQSMKRANIRLSNNPPNLNMEKNHKKEKWDEEGAASPLFYYFVLLWRNPQIAVSDLQVLLWPATQGIFKSGNMSAPWKVRCTWLYCKVGNEAVKGQAMNWMLPCTGMLQTKDKPCIWLSLFFLSEKSESGGCCEILAAGQNSSIQEEDSALRKLMRLRFISIWTKWIIHAQFPSDTLSVWILRKSKYTGILKAGSFSAV